MKLSLSQLQDLAASENFPDPPLAAAVAMAESDGNTNAYNPEGSYGLWQVDIVYHPEFRGDPSVLYDAATNAKAAYRISSGGRYFGPWSTAWEDPVRRTGYLGPKAPVSRWYKPAQPAGSSWLVPLLEVAGFALLGFAIGREILHA